MVNSRRYVEAPATPPLPYGLLSAAVVINDTDPHLGAGVEYETLGCGPVAATSVAACTTGSTNPLTSDDGYDLVGSDAFTVYALHTCRLVGDLGRYTQAARDKLDLGQGRAIETQFSKILTAASDITPTAGTAVEPKQGIALLEEFAAANYAGIPTLHMTRGTASIAGLAPKDGRLQTSLGSYVAAGGGYATALTVGAGGTARTSTNLQRWMWVTGTVVVRLGPVQVTDPVMGLAAPKNEVGVLASRPVTVTSECIAAAVLVKAPAVVTP